MRYAALCGALVVFLAGCNQTGIASTERPNEAQSKKVLIVTGIDYPGHKWKLTAPVLAQAIAVDKRLDVTVTEKPADLFKRFLFVVENSIKLITGICNMKTPHNPI